MGGVPSILMRVAFKWCDIEGKKTRFKQKNSNLLRLGPSHLQAKKLDGKVWWRAEVKRIIGVGGGDTMPHQKKK